MIEIYRLQLSRVHIPAGVLYPPKLWKRPLVWEGAEVLPCPVLGCQSRFVQSNEPGHSLDHHARLSEHYEAAHGEARVKSYPWKWLTKGHRQ